MLKGIQLQTASTLSVFIAAMMENPSYQEKAQEELMRVVGQDRMPEWEDMSNLPYVEAVFKEVLRWRPVNKFGMTHATSEDDWYEGHFIPKGSVAVLNWWYVQAKSSLIVI